MWTAISEILWNIGEKQKVIIGLPGDIPHIQHSHSYFADGVTEKLYLFEFSSKEELQIFLKRYLYYVSIYSYTTLFDEIQPKIEMTIKLLSSQKIQDQEQCSYCMLRFSLEE